MSLLFPSTHAAAFRPLSSIFANPRGLTKTGAYNDATSTLTWTITPQATPAYSNAIITGNATVSVDEGFAQLGLASSGGASDTCTFLDACAVYNNGGSAPATSVECPFTCTVGDGSDGVTRAITVTVKDAAGATKGTQSSIIKLATAAVDTDRCVDVLDADLVAQSAWPSAGERVCGDVPLTAFNASHTQQCDCTDITVDNTARVVKIGGGELVSATDTVRIPACVGGVSPPLVTLASAPELSCTHGIKW